MTDGLSALIRGEDRGAARIVLTQRRAWAFRWLVVPEAVLGFALLCCLLPVFAVLVVISEGEFDGFDLDGIAGRAWRYWHEIEVTVLAADGTVLGTETCRPDDDDEANGMVREVLTVADSLGLTVLHRIAGGATGRVRTWYGGQPLMEGPERASLTHALAVLTDAGATVEDQSDTITLRWADEPNSRLFALLLLPFALIGMFARGGRESLADSWDDVLGRPPSHLEVELHPDSLRVERHRNGRRLSGFRAPGRELLGIWYGPSLGASGQVRTSPPRLRVTTRSSSMWFRMPSDEIGRALADWMVDRMLELRDRHPELQLAGREPRKARCPFCATVYVFAAGSGCPQCGAPPGRLGEG